ncbi:fimbrial protein [Erwinia billingiae]|uniref:fimbrial protein n=1 Tax=Erwinia billingiae TaxID=182337 RepID=UPI003209BCDB
MKITQVRGAGMMLAALTLLSGDALAGRLGKAGDQFTLDINISGTVIATGSCTFNQKGTNEVNFGNILFSNTSSGYRLISSYVKELTSGMSCSGDTDGNAVMTLSSIDQSAVSYNGHKLLSTSINGAASSELAIELQVNGVAQDINTAFAVDMQNPPTLTAELLQTGDGSGLVDNADISANATLTMAFN